MVQAAQEGTLAGAAGAEDGHDGTGGDVEADAAQHLVLAEGFVQVADAGGWDGFGDLCRVRTAVSGERSMRHIHEWQKVPFSDLAVVWHPRLGSNRTLPSANALS